MRQRLTGLAMIASLFLPGLTLAVQSAPAAEPSCTCRFAGQSYEQGACVCINTSNGPRIACCGKVLNNTSWKFTGDSCPVAALPEKFIPAFNRAVDSFALEQPTRWAYR